MTCTYCSRPVQKQVDPEITVCAICWELLKNPATALPLIRGHLTMTLRGKIPESELKNKINEFMKMISTWQKKIQN